MTGALLFLAGSAAGFIARGVLHDAIHSIALKALTSAIGKDKVAAALAASLAKDKL